MTTAGPDVGVRLRRWLIGGALLAVGAGSIVACGTDAARGAGSEAGARSAGARSAGDLEWSSVDVGGLAGQLVALGQVVSGDALPVVALGDAETRSTAWIIDPDDREVTRLPALPGDPWLTDAHVASSSEFVVVSARPCAEAPEMDDLGPGCDSERTVSTVYSLRLGDGEWTSTEIPEAELAPVIDDIVGSTAELTIVGTQDDGVRAATVDLDGGGAAAALGPAGQAPPSRCSVRTIPALSFDAADAPDTAYLPAQAGEPARSVDLGRLRLRNMVCTSSRSYVLVVGGAPSGEPAANEIHDLAEPGAGPITTGNAFVNRLVAGTTYLAQVEMSSVRVMGPDGGDIAVRAFATAPETDDAFEGTDRGLFHFGLDGQGLVTGLDVALVR